VGTFVAFASISGYFGWTGVANCGCFGVIRASPWTVFGVDVAALTLLVVVRPEFSTGTFRLPAGVWVFVAASAGLMLALAGVGWWVYGSPQAALARIRGDVLSASPAHVDFGDAVAGQVVERKVDVRNWSDQPVRVIGGTSDCSCVTTIDLPLTIPPGVSRPVRVQMTIPRSTLGTLTRTVELWTAFGDRRSIRIQVGCRVVK
jgi:hypothetical protein